ncbi:FecR family protein [Pedobacter sp. BMA]|uniref:FecR family protein n=1 Tax=Pedobacter sp. BMA TaxID=1663685 RepID=UPI00064B420E|nr:FecR family protein [Pedobacter sp. BMA]KLT66765.1 hypothetical protein AB669_06325 [Pedobacter sp. BMA]
MKTNAKKLIKRYLNNDLSPQQQAKLETWYLLKAEEADTHAPEPDFDQIDTRLWHRILQDTQHFTPKEKSLKLKYLFAHANKYVRIGIAASLLLIAGSGYFLLNQKNMVNERFTISKRLDLAPGADKAILQLSDGRKIILNQDLGTQVAIEAGVEITKSSDGTLTYKALPGKAGSAGFNTISTPAGGQYAVVLPDGSKVYLNAKSSLRYPTAFSSTARKVTLSGEGYFEVAHQEQKGRVLPFIVSVIQGDVPAQEVQVLGTHFNINAYQDEPIVKTTLLQGSVKVAASDGQQVMLKPGQQSALAAGHLQLSKADSEMAIAWKNGEFVFREDLRSALRKVARWYDVEVVYEKSAPEQLMLGGWMSRGTNISEVLNHIQLTGKVHFKLEGRRVIVSE